MTTILPSMAADTCFRDIGIRQVTCGAFRHEVIAYFMSIIPKKVMQRAFFPGSKKALAKIRARESAEA
jgi:hypothetical protein